MSEDRSIQEVIQDQGRDRHVIQIAATLDRTGMNSIGLPGKAATAATVRRERC